MKKILASVAVVALMSVAAIGATRAFFSDTVTSTGNTFAAGTLDLEVDGGDVLVPFSVLNMKPGDTLGSPTYELRNVGSLPGVLSFKVMNMVTNENGVIQPEDAAGDAVDLRLDPDGYSIVASGYGELLDQVYIRFWVDDTPGQRPANFDWQDNKFWAGYPDESSYYSLPVDTDLMAGKGITLDPGEVLYMGVVTKFIDDTNTSYSWILDGVPNNAAMGDDFTFDLEVSLSQL